MDDALYRIFYEQENHHWWFVARRAIVLDAIERYGNLAPGDTVLDVGCGTGATLEALSAKYRVVGTDASPLAVKYSKMRGVADVYEGLLDALPLGKFDIRAALLLDVIEHIDDDVAALCDVRDRIADDGRIIVTVPAFQWLWSAHDEANHHKRRYDAAHLRRSLASAGLEALRLTYFNTFLFPLAAVRRLLDRGKSREDAHAALTTPPAPVNGLFRHVFEAEKHVLPRVNLPFGVSLLAVARRIR